MKRQQLLALGIQPKTLDEVEIDVTKAVLDEEFRKRSAGPGPGHDYRSRTVARLVEMGCSWHSEQNTLSTVFTGFLKVQCPYCSDSMKVSGCSGNSSDMTFSYMCHCGATSQISIPVEGISFTPHQRGEQ